MRCRIPPESGFIPNCRNARPLASNTRLIPQWVSAAVTMAQSSRFVGRGPACLACWRSGPARHHMVDTEDRRDSITPFRRDGPRHLRRSSPVWQRSSITRTTGRRTSSPRTIIASPMSATDNAAVTAENSSPTWGRQQYGIEVDFVFLNAVIIARARSCGPRARRVPAGPSGRKVN